MGFSGDGWVSIAKGDRGGLMDAALNLLDLPRKLKPTTRVLIKPSLVRVLSSSPYVTVRGHVHQ